MYASKLLLGSSNQGEWDKWHIQNALGWQETSTKWVGHTERTRRIRSA